MTGDTLSFRHAMGVFALLLSLLFVPLSASADDVVVPPPPINAVCPVCGMFVAKYPEWIAAVVYKDGHAHYFDGAKDLFKFLASPKRYVPGHRPEDVATIAVTDYYETTRIDAYTAFYVMGSDVMGPMGHELVPFPTRAAAEEFVKDHGGSAILTFDQVTSAILDRLDHGNVR